MAEHFPLRPSGSSLGACAVLVGVTIVASGYDKLKLLYWLSSRYNCGKELQCSQKYACRSDNLAAHVLITTLLARHNL
jgi:hypothetical protein